LVWRTGVLQRASEHRELIVSTGLVALVLTIGAGQSLATVTLALAYGCFIIAAAGTPLGSKLLGWAAPLGRIAFTNYLMQSLLFGFTLYGYGFDLFGKLGAATALSFGVVVHALREPVVAVSLQLRTGGMAVAQPDGRPVAGHAKTSPGVTVPAE
jgi:uncharacterized protein